MTARCNKPLSDQDCGSPSLGQPPDCAKSRKKVAKVDADIAWFIYDLELTQKTGPGPGRYTLKKVDEVFTEFESSLLSITTALPGKVDDFVKLLQEKLDDQLETPPVNKTIEKPF